MKVAGYLRPHLVLIFTRSSNLLTHDTWVILLDGLESGLWMRVQGVRVNAIHRLDAEIS